MIFMGVILKIPVVFACWLLWSAIKAEPDPVEGGEDGGSPDPGHRRFRREPTRPKGPRRGPHGSGALPLPCPEEGELRVARAPLPGRIPAPSGAERERR